MPRTLSRMQSRWYWAVKGLVPPLRTRCDALADRMAKLTRGILLSHYDIGRIVAGIAQDQSVYGSNAVMLLAQCLGVCDVWLWRLRNLTIHFSREELEQLAARRMDNGGHITLEHVHLLAGLERPQERRELTERVFAEALTHRQLAKLIRQRDPRRAANIRPVAPGATAASPTGSTRSNGGCGAAPRAAADHESES